MYSSLPFFGETNYKQLEENKKCRLTVIFDTALNSYFKYCDEFSNTGFTKKQSYSTSSHYFSAFLKQSVGVFINYYENTGELYIVEETSTKYFDFEDSTTDACVKPLITSMHLEDFGMSYVVRLSDGRFIIFDGGWQFEIDADRLYTHLKQRSPHEKPIIAAWILTHPHCDHFHLFVTFANKYKDCIDVQKVMLNFPEHDDFVHYPPLKNDDKRIDHDVSPYAYIPKMYSAIETVGAKTHDVHSGQIYQIGDAKCEILTCMDDTIFCSSNINASSVVVRMTISGQVILWTADAALGVSKILQKYGNYLKCDILQVPHHGFGSGDEIAHMQCYDVMKPDVCLLPVIDYNAYTAFCTYVGSTEYLMRDLGIKQLITGDKNVTIELPYTPPEYAKEELRRKFLSGRDNGGSCTWIFSDLEVENELDACFTILNTVNSKANISIDVFTPDRSDRVRFIKFEALAECVSYVNIFDKTSVDGDSEYFNWLSLEKNGKPKTKEFCVRFMSDLPVVVSHKKHKASFVAQYR